MPGIDPAVKIDYLFSKRKNRPVQNDMYPLYWTPSRGGISMRYSYEFKRKCVEMYRSGQWPETPSGIKQDNFRIMIRKWVRLADANGLEVLKHKKSHKAWTPEERLDVVTDVLSGKSTKSVALENGIDDGQLYRWVRKYKISGYNGLVERKKGRPAQDSEMRKTNNTPRKLTETEYEELIRLRAEIEYMKAENAVIKKEIALREEKQAALLKAKKQQSSRSSAKKDTN